MHGRMRAGSSVWAGFKLHVADFLLPLEQALPPNLLVSVAR
jgi:hypothetical protein